MESLLYTLSRYYLAYKTGKGVYPKSTFCGNSEIILYFVFQTSCAAMMRHNHCWFYFGEYISSLLILYFLLQVSPVSI